MTYPPHPGPAPHGQYSGGSAPHNVGQYPAAGPPGVYGSFAPPPPPSGGKAGVWVGVGLAVVTLVVFVITAFVAPGFLVGDDSESERAAEVHTAVQRTAQDLGYSIKDALKAGQSNAVTPLLCPDATESLKTFAEGIRQPQPHFSGYAREDGGTATVDMRLFGDAVGRPDINGEVTAIADLEKQGGGWCWRDLQHSVGYLDELRDALNSGDVAALHSMQCPTSAVGAFSDPFAEAVVLDSHWTIQNPDYASSTMPGADFVSVGGTLEIGIQSSGGAFCIQTAILS